MTLTHFKSIASQALVHDNHKLLLYHDSESLQYDYYTIDIIFPSRLSKPDDQAMAGLNLEVLSM